VSGSNRLPSPRPATARPIAHKGPRASRATAATVLSAPRSARSRTARRYSTASTRCKLGRKGRNRRPRRYPLLRRNLPPRRHPRSRQNLRIHRRRDRISHPRSPPRSRTRSRGSSRRCWCTRRTTGRMPSQSIRRVGCRSRSERRAPRYSNRRSMHTSSLGRGTAPPCIEERRRCPACRYRLFRSCRRSNRKRSCTTSS
jgi:hypothetical protein